MPIRHAKIGVLTALTLSALIGLTWLRFFSPPVRADEEEAIATEMMRFGKHLAKQQADAK